MFNFNEHFEFIGKHEARIKEILEDNTQLMALTHEKEMEKDAIRCY